MYERMDAMMRDGETGEEYTARCRREVELAVVRAMRTHKDGNDIVHAVMKASKGTYNPAWVVEIVNELIADGASARLYIDPGSKLELSWALARQRRR